MVTNTASAQPVAASRFVAHLSVAAAMLSLVSLAALHVLSPEFDPSWRMVSEYALGNYSGLLSLMFISMSVSCVALFFAIKPQVRTLGGKIGLGLLLAGALGLAMASVFDVTHSLHGPASLIGNPGLSLAAIVLSVSLSRTPAWSSARRQLLLVGNLPWVSLVLMVATLFIGLSQNGGEFGPDVLVGWPNRLVMFAYGAWLITVARRASQLSDTAS